MAPSPTPPPSQRHATPGGPGRGPVGGGLGDIRVLPAPGARSETAGTPAAAPGRHRPAQRDVADDRWGRGHPSRAAGRPDDAA